MDGSKLALGAAGALALAAIAGARKPASGSAASTAETRTGRLGVGDLRYEAKLIQGDWGESVVVKAFASEGGRVGEVVGRWEESPRGVEAHEASGAWGRGWFSCASDLKALGMQGDRPNLLSIHWSEVSPAWRGRGVGVALYATLLREAAAWVARHPIRRDQGPVYAVPHACIGAGSTSPDALRVWRSLSRRLPSRGNSVRVDLPVESAAPVAQAAPRPARAPLKLYHGAQRWEGPPQIVAHRKGHAEHGPGIYLTTSYETAAKYAKGGGSVYQMELDPELRWMDKGFIPAREAIEFVEGLPRLRGRSDILEGIQRVLGWMGGGGTIPAQTLLNIFVNAGAASGKHGPAIAAFFVRHGADASLTEPPLFGGSGGKHGEDWVVVFNPRVIRGVVKVSAKDVGKGFPFDLPRVRAALATPAGDVRPAGSQSSRPVRFQGPDQAKQAAMAAREGVLADPNFQAWFEGSEVTDKAGEPLVVYHGTHVDSIEAFESSGQIIFFATKHDFAALYGAWIYPVYLRCLNLFDYRHGARSMARDFYTETGGISDDFDARKILMGLSQTHPSIEITDGADERYSASDLTRELFAEALAGGAWEAIEAYDFLSYLRGLGYDGVVLLELGSINYGVFKPEQIKSATGNSGTFDLRSPNISMNKVKGSGRRSS